MTKGITSPPLRVFVGSTTKDQVSGGNQAITGVGFKPKAVIFFSAQSGTANEYCFGFDDDITTGDSIYKNYDGNFNSNTGNSITINEAASTSFNGNLASLDADGFTIEWVRTGTPTGTVNIHFLCIG